MASTINASSTANGIVSTADASGILNVQSNGVNTNAQAWVRFDSSSGSSCTINASYNVSSVTYNSTGNYFINFTNAFTDANYSMGASAGVLPGSAGGYLGFADNSTVPSTTSARVFSNNSAGTPTNFTRLSATFFR